MIKDNEEKKLLQLPTLFTIDEASKILKIKISKIRKAIFRKEISYIKLGGLVRFREQDLNSYIQKNVIDNT